MMHLSLIYCQSIPLCMPFCPFICRNNEQKRYVCVQRSSLSQLPATPHMLTLLMTFLCVLMYVCWSSISLGRVAECALHGSSSPQHFMYVPGVWHTRHVCLSLLQVLLQCLVASLLTVDTRHRCTADQGLCAQLSLQIVCCEHLSGGAMYMSV